MPSDCNCEQALALKAENERLRLLRTADEKELSQLHVRQCDLNQQALDLLELAGELVAYIDEEVDSGGVGSAPDRDPLLARAKAQGIGR
jgi:hypothetical protein